ncbi:MAG: 30S ribosomal protein S17 [archaeon]
MENKMNTKKDNTAKNGKYEAKSNVTSAVYHGECGDRLCPKHGTERVKTRGRVFQGTVIRKFHGRVTIQFERMLYIQKYERYEKRKTKLHARLTKCMENDVNMGDLIEIAETRPISKMIHFIVTQVIKKNSAKTEDYDEAEVVKKSVKKPGKGAEVRTK